MSKTLDLVKEFLDSIPGFIRDLEPHNPYLEVTQDVPIPVWKTVKDFHVTENDLGNGFIVKGHLAVPMVDLITFFTGWHIFVGANRGRSDDELYEEYLQYNKNLISDFNLKEFCDNFSDFYLEFLNNSGLDEDSLEISADSVILKNDSAVSGFDVINESALDEDEPVGQ